MSELNTKSKFYYGYEIDDTSFYLDFNEGSGEITVELDVDSYTLTDLLTEISTKMSAAGTQDYTASVDRSTRIVTISAASAFTLLGATGTNAGQACFSVIGFSASDTASLTSHNGSSAAGTEFKPQFYLQRFIAPEDFKQSSFSKINKSANGTIEAVSFDEDQFYEFNIQLQTNQPQTGKHFMDNDPQGLENLRAFLDYAITKGEFEIMLNRDDPDTYDKVLLEKIKGSSTGTGYKILEMRGLRKFYESGRITLRKV